MVWGRRIHEGRQSKAMVTWCGVGEYTREDRVEVFDTFFLTSKQIRQFCFILINNLFQDVAWSLLTASCDYLVARMTSQAPCLHAHTQITFTKFIGMLYKVCCVL